MSVDEFIAEWESGAPTIRAHTSGSTGTPKDIELPRAAVEASALRSIKVFSLSSLSRVHLCLSPDYIAGKMAIVRALLSGARLTWEEPSSTPLLSEQADLPITLLPVVGAQIPALAASKQSGSLPSIEHLLVGGAPLNSHLADMALQVAENVWESYGMTETASHVALRKIHNTCDIESTPFKLLPGVKAGLDERGCLTLKLPDLSPVVTGDMAEFLSPDEFFVRGRIDNVIITGAVKVHPEQVEKELCELLDGFFAQRAEKTPAFYVGSEPDDQWGRKLCLILEACSLPQADRLALLELCSNIPASRRPRKIKVCAKLPRTANGKLIRG